MNDFSLDQIRTQIAALPYRKAKDSAAVLVKAIRENWAPPVACLAAEKERQEEEKRAAQAQCDAERACEERARKEDEDRQLDRYWNELSLADRSAIEQKALEQLRQKNKLMADRLAKNPQSGIARNALEAIRRELLVDRLQPG